MGLKKAILKYRRFLAALMYAAITAMAYILAFFFRFEFTVPADYYPLIRSTLPALLLIKLVIYQRFGLFSGLWRYVSIEDLWQIFKATVTATVLFILYCVFAFHLEGFPRSVLVFDWMLSMGIISGARLFFRFSREVFLPKKNAKHKKGLIVGAGEAGILVLKELKSNLNIDVVGFVDDDPMKKDAYIHGKKVLGGRQDIQKLVERLGISEIIIAMPRESGQVIREMLSCCSVPGIKVKIVPGMYEILSGQKEIRVRDVRPEDLLGRESVAINEREMEEHLRGKVVLITGAAGSIGSEITKQVLKYCPERIVMVDHNENDLYFLEREIKDKTPDVDIMPVAADITAVNVLKATFSRFRPQVVFHAAAYKHVPLMEENPASAVQNNVIGSRNLIYASEHYGVERFVLISSDKAVNPTNVMGATKRVSEMVMQAKARKSRTNFIAVRFGNVLGSKGSVVPLFKKQIEEDRRVTVTHPDATRYFMSIKEAVQLVLQAGTIGKSGEIMVLDMGEQINIVDFAEDLIKLSGLEPERDVKIEFIGLRPGEKLYEEPLHDKERDAATKHEKIFITRPEDLDIKKVLKGVKELEKDALHMDNGRIVETIKELLPEFKDSIAGKTSTVFKK